MVAEWKNVYSRRISEDYEIKIILVRINIMNQTIIKDGTGTYYYNDKDEYHREDGPAVEGFNGCKFWYINGKAHREDGPAVQGSNGCKQWYINGRCHREDGPAVERPNGDKYWYINGKKCSTEEQFGKIMRLRLFW